MDCKIVKKSSCQFVYKHTKRAKGTYSYETKFFLNGFVWLVRKSISKQKGDDICASVKDIKTQKCVVYSTTMASLESKYNGPAVSKQDAKKFKKETGVSLPWFVPVV